MLSNSIYYLNLKLKIYLVFFGLLISPLIFGQLVTISSGAAISVGSGSSITLGGLEIVPAANYVILGDNSVSRSNTAVTFGENSSVSRVYNTAALFTDFTGTLIFSYLDGELNGIDESKLVLELQADDGSWTSYQATLDPNANTVSYSFNDPVSFKAVTASAAGATLTIEDISSIFVYPNPTADRIYIKADKIKKAELFDLMGRKVRSTNQLQIDVSNLSNGNYILYVKTENNTQSFKILKQ